MYHINSGQAAAYLAKPNSQPQARRMRPRRIGRPPTYTDIVHPTPFSTKTHGIRHQFTSSALSLTRYAPTPSALSLTRYAPIPTGLSHSQKNSLYFCVSMSGMRYSAIARMMSLYRMIGFIFCAICSNRRIWMMWWLCPISRGFCQSKNIKPNHR